MFSLSSRGRSVKEWKVEEDMVLVIVEGMNVKEQECN